MDDDDFEEDEATGAARRAENRRLEHLLRLEVQQAQAHVRGQLGSTTKCSTCGLLARRGVAGSTVFEEVSLLDRVEGDVFSMRTVDRASYPWCMVSAWPLPAQAKDKYDEFMAQPDKAKYGPDYVQQIAASLVIASERDCKNDWILYQEGERPAEARARRDMMVVREKEAKREQDWQEFQADLAVRLHEDNKTLDQKLHDQSQSLNRRLAFAAVVAIVLAAFAVVATLYPDEMRAFIESVWGQLTR